MNYRTLARLSAGTLVLAAAACSEATSPATTNGGTLDAAFNVVPAGFSNVESSFIGGGSDGFVGALADGMRGGRGGFRGGPGSFEFQGPGLGQIAGRGGPGFGGMMGGGIFNGVEGLIGGGRPGVGDLTGCTLQADGRVTCPDVVRNGITISRSFAFTTTGGTAQAKPDSTTNTVNARDSVYGTLSHPRGGTSTVNHASDRTVTGLAAGSTQRTINSSSHGSEISQFTNDSGVAITMQHTATNAVHNVIVPVSSTGPTYPISGTVDRSMTVVVTEAGAVVRTMTRREVVTYNGTATATLVVTTNGETKTCSLPLPHGRPTCE